MSGHEPKQVWSINLSSINLYMTVTLGLIAIVGAIWGVGAIAASWMSGQAEINFDHRIKREVSPPAGIVYKAITEEVGKTENSVQEQLTTMEKRQIRNDIMVEEVFQEVTGRPPPPRIDE